MSKHCTDNQLKGFFQAVNDECVFESSLKTKEMETTKGILFALTLKL